MIMKKLAVLLMLVGLLNGVDIVRAADSLEYYGYYFSYNNVEKTKGFSNLAFSFASLSDLSQLTRNKAAGQKTVIDLRWQFWSGKSLRSDWKTRWEKVWQLYKPYANDIAAWYIIDEPDINANRVDYELAAEEIKKTLEADGINIPILMVMTYYTPRLVVNPGRISEFPRVDSSWVSGGKFVIPKNVDWIGFDQYDCWESCGDDKLKIVDMENVLLSAAKKVNPNMKLVVIPGAYRSDVAHINDVYQNLAIDLVQKYYDYCIGKVECVGIINFLYESPNVGIVGANLMPRVLEKQKALGQLALSTISTPTPHPIQVRQAADGTGGEFYDTRTGTAFTPRGNNYILLSPGHSNFDVGVYSQTNSENILNKMSHDGYNTVRVFISRSSVGNPDGGLLPGYLDNFSDFLTRAKSKNLFVIPTFELLPGKGGYRSGCNSTQVSGEINPIALTQPCLDGKKRYLTDFILGLQTRNAPTDYILGYAIENEFFYQLKQKPFTLTSGIVQTPAGSFDMTKPADRRMMMDKNLVNYTNQLRNTIKSVDPTALVTIGFFTPRADPANRDVRTYWIFADPEIGGSSLDFVDLHFYPYYGSVAQHITSFEITSHKKPILMGEFGADKNSWPDINQAAYKLRDIQIESCQYNIRGWLLWGWGTPAINKTGYYSAEENGGTINGQLAPVARPNPCSATFASPTPTKTPTPTPTPAFLPGDLDHNHKVDMDDYNILKADFGKTGSPGFIPADIDKNGKVDIFDYNVLVGNFGK